MTNILEAEPAFPSGSRCGPLWPVIARCLEKVPARRYQRGADVRDALTVMVR